MMMFDCPEAGEKPGPRESIPIKRRCNSVYSYRNSLYVKKNENEAVYY